MQLRLQYLIMYYLINNFLHKILYVSKEFIYILITSISTSILLFYNLLQFITVILHIITIIAIICVHVICKIDNSY